MTIARPMVRGIARPMARPLLKGVGGVIRSIFADGTDGFYFDFSKTDRLFQSIALTPADDAGENIGLALEGHAWAGRSFAQQVLQQTELFTGSVGISTGWTLGSGWSISGGRVVAASALGTIAYYAVPQNPAGFYRVEVTVAERTASDVVLRLFDNSNANVTTSISTYYSAAGTYVVIGYATAPWTRIALAGGGGVGFSGSISGVSVKYISGNHGLQATSAAQPKWQTGGLARFDGSDDNLLTTLVPSNDAMSLLLKFKPESDLSALKVPLGGASAAGNRLYLGITTAGYLGAAVGDTSFTTIVGSTDIRSLVGVAALVITTTTYALYYNGTLIASGTRAGGVGTPPISLGALATPAAHCNCDIYHALAIKKALTAAEIAAITNQWGTP